MNWTPIAMLEIDAACSKGLRTRAKELAAKVEDLIGERQALDYLAAQADQEDLATFDAGAAAVDMRQGRVMCLQHELAIRGELDALDADHREELSPLHRAAADHFEAECQRITEALVSLGWQVVPRSGHKATSNRIDPAFILSNPAVRAAKERRDSLMHARNSSVFGTANKAARKQTMDLLQQIRQRVTREVLSL